jgi:hypothetical protein
MEFDSNVTPPLNLSGLASRYSLDKIKPGNSFFAEGDAGFRRKLRNAVLEYGKENGKNLVTRQLKAGDTYGATAVTVEGLAVWCLEPAAE